jgi:hypothetical protein
MLEVMADERSSSFDVRSRDVTRLGIRASMSIAWSTYLEIPSRIL